VVTTRHTVRIAPECLLASWAHLTVFAVPTRVGHAPSDLERQECWFDPSGSKTTLLLFRCKATEYLCPAGPLPLLTGAFRWYSNSNPKGTRPGRQSAHLVGHCPFSAAITKHLENYIEDGIAPKRKAAATVPGFGFRRARRVVIHIGGPMAIQYEDDPLFTSQEAADYLNVSLSRFYKMRMGGKGPR
jgi:hypothetical protein